jgi:hypothetical protein
MLVLRPYLNVPALNVGPLDNNAEVDDNAGWSIFDTSHWSDVGGLETIKQSLLKFRVLLIGV